MLPRDHPQIRDPPFEGRPDAAPLELQDRLAVRDLCLVEPARCPRDALPLRAHRRVLDPIVEEHALLEVGARLP